MNAPANVPVKVFGLPPIWGSPSPSPFSIKVMTWLRMAGIEYERPPMKGPPKSATGKVPWVELADGEVLSDSSLIIERLSADRGIDLDAVLDAHTRAVGVAIQRMIEEHLYFVGAWERWLTDDGFAHSSRDYFRHLPGPIRFLLPRMLRRKMRANVHGQGVGRHSPKTITAMAKVDIDALAVILGDNEFVLGPPSTLDASTFGLVWAMRSNPYQSDLRKCIEAHPNLVAYAERMRERYWSDW
jgi:glutathione S-transferase